MAGRPQFPPVLTFPDDVADYVRGAYAKASVILEYGSGGSTWLAAGLPGKTVFSVESDRSWADRMRWMIGRSNLPSPPVILHVDIGETGAWGRPYDDRRWRHFHEYPTRIWDAPGFRQPDLILIDGRFRPACLVTAMLRTKAPVTVLFDDYVDRERYHAVEEVIKPVETVGRMAVFHVEPNRFPIDRLALALRLFGETRYAQRPELHRFKTRHGHKRRRRRLNLVP